MNSLKVWWRESFSSPGRTWNPGALGQLGPGTCKVSGLRGQWKRGRQVEAELATGAEWQAGDAEWGRRARCSVKSESNRSLAVPGTDRLEPFANVSSGTSRCPSRHAVLHLTKASILPRVSSQESCRVFWYVRSHICCRAVKYSGAPASAPQTI